MTRVDVNFHVFRIFRSSQTLLAFHIVEQGAVQFLYQTRHLLADRLLCEVDLHEVDISIIGVIHNTTRLSIYIRIHTHTLWSGQTLNDSTVHRCDHDRRLGEEITIVVIVHTYYIIVAIPYRSIEILTEVDNLITIEVANSSTLLGIEENHRLVW